MSSAQRPNDAEADQLPPVVLTRFDVAPLYQRHETALRRYASSFLPAHLSHEADAALMTVFVRLLDRQQRGILKERENWEAYLVKAVRNACIDIIKSAKNDAELDNDDPRIHRAAPNDPTGDAVANCIDDAARRDLVKAALDRLEPRQRFIVIAKEDERTNKDIGAELGLTGQRVGQLYERALHELREELNPSDG